MQASAGCLWGCRRVEATLGAAAQRPGRNGQDSKAGRAWKGAHSFRGPTSALLDAELHVVPGSEESRTKHAHVKDQTRSRCVMLVLCKGVWPPKQTSAGICSMLGRKHLGRLQALLQVASTRC